MSTNVLNVLMLKGAVKAGGKKPAAKSKAKSAKPFVRARIDASRKANAEKILEQIGVTPAQAINMLYAQIEMKRGLPFAPVLDNRDVLTPIEHVAEEWGKLDRNDYSYLLKK